MIMKNFSLNFNLIYFHYLFLLALFTFYSTIGSTQKIPIPSDPIGDIVCEAVHCGQGVCKASNETLLGFDCECNPGWKKIPIGPLTYPACVIPNCTVNFQCDGSASPPPPPAPMVPPPGCEFVWCGDGTCVANGTRHVCQCPEGTWNLLDMPGLACFKACKLIFSKP
ncbi:hypothetical protein D8674_039678 [Pyrus ussuriensis x Pyrus communis]|uniref:EGF-like domain-containing protein n=1 Tax=Pyrus ussuriensis x Pyrus communis TaxID=2448454 RepID=A0A5N5GE81_9ROSA|nr:hypothetical protein D8674_039678 [Pyrus ussuriensis x Pyrus communis]